MMQPDLPSDQSYFTAEQGNTFAQQEFVQTSSNDSQAIPQYFQYGPLPTQSSLDTGYQQAVWEYPLGVPQHAPAPTDSALNYGGHYGGHYGQYPDVTPFYQQVEDQDWDLPLADHPLAYGSPFEPEWNPFTNYN
jgi:hypothetical protein